MYLTVVHTRRMYGLVPVVVGCSQKKGPEMNHEMLTTIISWLAFVAILGILSYAMCCEGAIFNLRFPH